MGVKEILVDVAAEQSIKELMDQAEEIVFQKTDKRFLWKLIEEDGAIKQGTIILINGKNILDSDGLSCTVNPGDTIAVFPPGGGG